MVLRRRAADAADALRVAAGLRAEAAVRVAPGLRAAAALRVTAGLRPDEVDRVLGVAADLLAPDLLLLVAIA